MNKGQDDIEYRKLLIEVINEEIKSNDETEERLRLEKKYGKENVWNTEELKNNFIVHSFLAPFVRVTRKDNSNEKGTLLFQHIPRFYFKVTLFY